MESKKGENADMKESKGNISKKKINIKDIISNNKENRRKNRKFISQIIHSAFLTASNCRFLMARKQQFFTE